MNEIERVISLLGEKGISVTDIRNRLNITHGNFYSWRRSVKQVRRDELAEKIKEAFSEFQFGNSETDDQMESTSAKQETITTKYIKMLEETNESLKRERDLLRQENRELLERLKREYSEMAQPKQN